MKRSHLVAALLAAFTLSIQPSAQADTFGTSGNEFTIDFVGVGNTGNAADTTTYGAVPYEYRASTYEISQDAITKATASGMANVTAGRWTGNQPAALIDWYEAAAFVNFLNTNSGKTAAYNLTFTTNWSMALWSSGQAWTAGGTNLYRNKDALPEQGCLLFSAQRERVVQGGVLQRGWGKLLPLSDGKQQRPGSGGQRDQCGQCGL